jgi:hypothetical protein
MQEHRILSIRVGGYAIDLHQTKGESAYVVVKLALGQGRDPHFSLEALQHLVAQVESFGQEEWE